MGQGGSAADPCSCKPASEARSTLSSRDLSTIKVARSDSDRRSMSYDPDHFKRAQAPQSCACAKAGTRRSRRGSVICSVRRYAAAAFRWPAVEEAKSCCVSAKPGVFKVMRQVAQTRRAYLARLGITPTPESQAYPRRSRSKDFVIDWKERALSSVSTEASEDALPAHAGHVNDRPSGRDFRNVFLRKLSYEGVWLPPVQQPKRQQTLIVFDWDDTLLCTSYLSQRRGMMNFTSGLLQERLADIALAGTRLLELASRLGETLIITNAMDDWVESSAKKFLPSLLPGLQAIEVISARQRYEAQYPMQVSKWKREAFLDVRRKRNLDSVTNFIAIGDSVFEMDAAIGVGEVFPNAIVKTVKFRPDPSPEELRKELELAYRRLVYIVESGRDLQVAIERRSSSE